MINRQARCFADAGYGVLILDLFATGDSEGIFREATINIWQEDILAAIAWLAQTSATPPIFWAMRSGALIAADLIRQHPDITDQMILWSPVANGKKFITQFMRIKLASKITNKTNGQQITLKNLWANLDSGDSLEIAGYDLSSKLVNDFGKLCLTDMELTKKLSVKWIETSVGEPARLSPAAQNVVDVWKNNGIIVSTMAVNDISFWNLQEPDWAYGYIHQTTAFLAQ